MKSNRTRRSVVELSPSTTMVGSGGSKDRRIAGTRDSDAGQCRLNAAQLQRRAAPLAPRKALQQQHHRRRGDQAPAQEHLRVVAKPKLMPRFTRLQVLRIIKLATMDKLRESGATGAADDPTRQRLATAEGAAGGNGTGGGVSGGGAKGEGGSDEFHHQFYNTGRIGRRNALPDILGTHCTTTTADLSTQLGALSTSECTGKAADGSSSIVPPDCGQTPTTTGT